MINYTKPSIKLLDRSKFESPLHLIGHIARQSYQSFDKSTGPESDKELARKCLRAGHLGLLEHVWYKKRFIDKKDELTEYVKCAPAFARYVTKQYGKNLRWDNYELCYERVDVPIFTVTANLRTILDIGVINLKHILDEKPIPEFVPAEQDIFTFDIDATRCMQQQLTRHRMLSFNIESMRRINHNLRGVRFEQRPNKTQPRLSYSLLDQLHHKLTGFVYQQRLARGWPQEEARKVFPLETMGKIFVTAPKSDWKYIFKLRVEGTTGRPQGEIKYLMSEARRLIND